MKKAAVLNEIVIELSYFLYLLRRMRVDSVVISHDEVESHLRTVVSPEIARFIRDSVSRLRKGGKFSDYTIFFESKLLECIRNPDIRLDELRALHYSISIFEKCIGKDWDEFIDFTLRLLRDEAWEEHPSGSGGYELPVKAMRVQQFLREKDEQNLTVGREEFEHYKKEGWEQKKLLTDEEIQKVLSEGGKGRTATHEEIMLISETLIAEKAKNPSITLKEILVQLGLTDIETQTDFDF